MKEIIKIETDDGSVFDTYEEAYKYIGIEYGDLLTRTSHKILHIDKYVDMCQFIEDNLNTFKELLQLKNEMES